MIPRHATATLRSLAHGYPILALTGPRQAGKTTLAQIVARETLIARPDAMRIAQLGFDSGGLLTGPVAIEARTERHGNSAAGLGLRQAQAERVWGSGYSTHRRSC